MSNDFKLYYQGAEQKGWARLLLNEGVSNLGISFSYYQRKVAKKNWTLPEFPEGTSVMLDSGGFGANKKASIDIDWLAYEEDYFEFVEKNHWAADIITEFDMLSLGLEHTQEMREQFWGQYESKFLPIWHPQYGQEELEHLARRYDHVGVPGRALTEVAWLGSRINSLIRQHGTRFHGMALTQPDVLRNVHFTSAASTSWISPSKFGDTQIWDGHRLRRYPKRYKERARRKHQSAFSKAGFDIAKILNDDPAEVTRFTLWSWRKWEEHHNTHRRVTQPASGQAVDLTSAGPGRVVHPAPASRGDVALLPVLGLTDTNRIDVAPERPARQCRNCYVASQCPAFEPEASCAYKIPMQLRTREDMLTLLTGMIEMQGQRVMFGRFVEEMEGGYPDPNLGSEVDRLMKMVKDLRDLEDNRDTLKLNVEARSGAGLISRLFGEQPPSLPAPTTTMVQDADEVMGDYIDVEAEGG